MEYLMEFKKFEALINKRSLEQLKRVMKISKSTDIDDKVRKEIKEPPMRHVNPIENGVETYEEYLKEPFKVNQNVKSK